jgi:hypothetical protein
MDDVLAVLLVVGIRAWVHVDETLLERAVHQDGEFARGGGDGLGLADTKREATVEREPPRTGCG